MCLTMRGYDINTKLCSFVSLWSSVVAMAYLVVVWAVLVNGAVMRMLVRMTLFKTSGYLFLSESYQGRQR